MRSLIALVLMAFGSGSVSASEYSRVVSVIYPKDHAVVHDKVNLVLDPTEIPFFQVMVGATEYPIIDTSGGRHAYQGLTLKPGVNKITVRVFTVSPDPHREELELIASREISVFSRIGLYARESIPPEFKELFFHSREREASCSGCHELDVEQKDPRISNSSEEMICSGCHRTLPVGNNVHEPAAAWQCLACHDPELYPVKYQFTTFEPWRFSTDTSPVKPLVRTVPATELFERFTDTMVSGKKVKKVLENIVSHLKRYPDDKARLEVHSDITANADVKNPLVDSAHPEKRETDAVVPRKRGFTAFSTSQALSEARARKLRAFFRDSGVADDRVIVAGMAETMAVTSDAMQSRRIDERVEIVLYPSEVTVENIADLPELQDRQRISLSLEYAQGPEVKSMKVRIKIPDNAHYLPGSGIVEGRTSEPEITGNAIIWKLGDKSPDFSFNLSYVLRKNKSASPKEPEITVTYEAGKKAITRDFTSRGPAKERRSVEDTCRKCHQGISDGKFGHEPAEGGHCDVCHNPHASSAASLLREPSWLLCTECHTDKTSGVHVIAPSHPTRGPHDPSQPDKQFSCVSCHNPHSSDNKSLLSHNAATPFALCKVCHQQ